MTDTERTAMFSFRSDEPVEVNVDSRRRVSLRKIGRVEHTRYRVTANEIGEILLQPLVSITVRELEFWKNADLRASVERGIAQAEAGKLVSRGSFAGYVTEDE